MVVGFTRRRSFGIGGSAGGPETARFSRQTPAPHIGIVRNQRLQAYDSVQMFGFDGQPPRFHDPTARDTDLAHGIFTGIFTF